MQHTLSVLQTLRSSEWRTAAANRSASAASPATSQAPPVPCRLTGVPAWRATAPSWATAAPEPRATASARRRSSNRAHPAARAGERTSDTAPPGSPAAASAGASASATIASAVRSASEPMRMTTVLPVRSTPLASAKTLGRPSNTNPTTPSGARRAATDQPAWSMRASTVSRAAGASRHHRSPATMSSRIRSDSTSRVVERPAAAAAATSASFAARIGRQHAVVGEAGREAVEEAVTCSSLHVASPANAACAPRPPGRGRVLRRGHVQQVAGLRDDEQPVAGDERGCQLGRHGRDPVAAEHDLLTGLQPDELAGARRRGALLARGTRHWCTVTSGDDFGVGEGHQ